MTTAILDKAPPADFETATGNHYYQCHFGQGEQRTTGWIEERGAKLGARVEIKGMDGLWDVLAVYKPPRDIAWLREKQRRDRGSLPSIAGRR